MTDVGKDTSVYIQSPADLLELKDRLLDELKTLETAKTAAELDTNSSSVTDLQKSVAELKDKLLEESNNVSLKQLIIKRLEMQVLLCEVLFKQNKEERDVAITRNSVDDLQIASEIIRIQKDAEALQQKHDKLRMDNLKLKHENSALMEKLKAQQEKAHSLSEEVVKNKEYRVLKSELDVRRKSLSILNNIIPRLAVGAGILNPEVQELVLQCGEPSNV